MPLTRLLLLALGHAAGAQVALSELPAQPGRLCEPLERQGYAVVRCDLGRRADLVAWLEASAGRPAEGLEEAFPKGVARGRDVAHPRRLRRLDLVATGPGLALELHQVALRCLEAVAEHCGAPELLELVSQEELLDEAKARSKSSP